MTCLQVIKSFSAIKLTFPFCHRAKIIYFSLLFDFGHFWALRLEMCEEPEWNEWAMTCCCWLVSLPHRYPLTALSDTEYSFSFLFCFVSLGLFINIKTVKLRLMGLAYIWYDITYFQFVGQLSKQSRISKFESIAVWSLVKRSVYIIDTDT